MARLIQVFPGYWVLAYSIPYLPLKLIDLRFESWYENLTKHSLLSNILKSFYRKVYSWQIIQEIIKKIIFGAEKEVRICPSDKVCFGCSYKVPKYSSLRKALI